MTYYLFCWGDFVFVCCMIPVGEIPISSISDTVLSRCRQCVVTQYEVRFLNLHRVGVSPCQAPRFDTVILKSLKKKISQCLQFSAA